MNARSVVLVIDDEPTVRDTLDALLSMEYTVHFAENGAIGLMMAIEIMPDIILLDVMMPLMDGYEVCRRIRITPALAQVPIIMVTALDDRDSRLAGLRAGADDFLSKPFDGLELLARLQTIARLNRYRQIVEQRNELEKTHQELLVSYQLTIEGWVAALDLRDNETEGHTQRVTQMTIAFAEAIGIAAEAMEFIRRGALLHDIGKLGVPDAILHKPGKLTEEEWVIMRKHPENAYAWISPIGFLRPALDIPYCHHEKWNGKGYPRGLCGEEIPIAARLFAIVDVYDALISKRPYKEPMSEAEALAIIEKDAGSHFDPALVKVFLDLRGYKSSH
jgi:putative two-component system response regulator